MQITGTNGKRRDKDYVPVNVRKPLKASQICCIPSLPGSSTGVSRGFDSNTGLRIFQGQCIRQPGQPTVDSRSSSDVGKVPLEVMSTEIVHAGVKDRPAIKARIYVNRFWTKLIAFSKLLHMKCWCHFV